MGHAALDFRNSSIFETTSDVAFASKIRIAALELMCQGSSLVAAAIVRRNWIDFDRERAPGFLFCFELGFGHRVLGVVQRIGFVLRAVIGDAAYDFLGIIAARKGAFRVRPVSFRLTPVSGRHAARWFQKFV